MNAVKIARNQQSAPNRNVVANQVSCVLDKRPYNLQ
ncbi:unnamed protein product [Nippostrongylus brasiliensis]|uniref:Transposase n=1 Tax=Nippostrongylus brasiliensis TaxID=27835 RepID=A0A0N4YZQ0_NIPBR|nr:unnamed protein product [Nippostrongylus brasiliensis]